MVTPTSPREDSGHSPESARAGIVDSTTHGERNPMTIEDLDQLPMIEDASEMMCAWSFWSGLCF
jgi:hypothetical protein